MTRRRRFLTHPPPPIRRSRNAKNRPWKRFLARRLLVFAVAAIFVFVSLPVGYHIWLVRGVSSRNSTGKTTVLNSDAGFKSIASFHQISSDGEKRDDNLKSATSGPRSMDRTRERALSSTETLSGTVEQSVHGAKTSNVDMATVAKKSSAANAGASSAVVGPSRFPPYGTSEYMKRCRWVLEAVKNHPPSNCTFFYAPSEVEHEGLSFWAAQVVSSHLLALSAGCRLVFNFGERVEMEQVILTPPTGESSVESGGNRKLCERDPSCHEIPHPKGTEVIGLGQMLNFEMTDRGYLPPVPRYRYAYARDRFRQSDNVTKDLERSLPGFDLEHGMSCSLGALFHLAPNVSHFEPDIFTRMLPALRDEEALVMGIYIRTDWADMSRTKSRSLIARNKGLVAPNGTVLPKGTRIFRDKAQPTLDAALAMERKYLTGEVEPNRHFTKIVWMVSTDAPYIKEWIVYNYNEKDANANMPKERNKYPSSKIPRKVIVTGSKGRHTRFSEEPSTAVFAEAFVDWFLLGEVDIVLTHKYSFAETAALRTSRPVYKNGVFQPFWAPMRADYHRQGNHKRIPRQSVKMQ